MKGRSIRISLITHKESTIFPIEIDIPEEVFDIDKIICDWNKSGDNNQDRYLSNQACAAHISSGAKPSNKVINESIVNELTNNQFYDQRACFMGTSFVFLIWC